MMVLVVTNVKCSTRLSFYDFFLNGADLIILLIFRHTRMIVGLNYQSGLRTWTLGSMNFNSRNVILFV